MEQLATRFMDLYQNFNLHRIALVIENMAPDVKWANGMEGGYVYGHAGVAAYWTKQFSMVNSTVTPIEIKQEYNEVRIKVHQVVHDLQGILLSDELVEHIFKLQNGKIAEFNIR